MRASGRFCRRLMLSGGKHFFAVHYNRPLEFTKEGGRDTPGPNLGAANGGGEHPAESDGDGRLRELSSASKPDLAPMNSPDQHAICIVRGPHYSIGIGHNRRQRSMRSAARSNDTRVSTQSVSSSAWA